MLIERFTDLKFLWQMNNPEQVEPELISFKLRLVNDQISTAGQTFTQDFMPLKRISLSQLKRKGVY